jgi:hypothetical protein
VRERGRIVPVPLSAVDWVEAEGDYVRIHAGGRPHLVERTLSEMEDLAPSLLRAFRARRPNVRSKGAVPPARSERGGSWRRID